MPPGQLDPLADDPWQGPCFACGEEADYHVAFKVFACDECLEARGE